MKRSGINAILHAAEEFLRHHHVALPPFAHLSPDRLRASDHVMIAQRRLGWDVTDYGKGDFAQLGLVLFTLRNGSLEDLKKGQGMAYAEKLLILRKGQVSPMHKHLLKTEDIINRAGGTLVMQVFASTRSGARDPDAPVSLVCDGAVRNIQAGATLKLNPGESVTLRPGDWHAFWAEDADCLLGEVSTVNDDETDNIFDPPMPRFAQIEEDVMPWRLLVSDYPQFLA